MGNYNNGMPYDMGTLTMEEKMAAIKEFAEGSEVLEECLITADKLGLETTNSCRGYHEIEDTEKFMNDYIFKDDLDMVSFSKCINPTYISFARESDIISYLSSELINNPNVRITANNKYCIYFYGEEHDSLLKHFTSDMKSGKKSNGQDLINKVNKTLAPEDYYKSFVYGFKNSGLTDDDIKLFRVIFGLNACRFTKTYEEIHEFCIKQGIPEDEEEIILNELNIQKNPTYK